MNKAITVLICVCAMSLNAQIETADGVYLAPYLSQNKISEAPVNKTAACSNTSEGDVGLVDCADIGTGAFASAGVLASVDSQGATAPSPAPSCDGGGTSIGNWTMMELDPGVTQVSVDYTGGFTGAGGFSDMWMSFYQGPNCANLTNVGCDQVIDKSGPTLILLDVSVSGLDPNQPLWVYTWGNKAYTADFTFNGAGDPPANDNCAGATNSTTGCNLGATPAAFTAPSTVLGAGACSGGTWYSNENTVFYSFTATTAAGTIDVSSLSCNDGTGLGEAQFGVWDNCANVGTYGAGFLGCAVGSGTLILPTLTIGNSYIIVVDGQAGDACEWDFITTGVLLPVEFGKLTVETYQGKNRVVWTTVSENNTSHFELERSFNGVDYSTVQTVSAAGYSTEEIEYELDDHIRDFGTAYYRVKQMDTDGEKSYFGPKAVHSKDAIGISVVPNPVRDLATVNYAFSKGKNYEYQVVDLRGQVIASGVFVPSSESDKMIIDTRELNDGMYLLQVTDNREYKSSVSFVKE